MNNSNKKTQGQQGQQAASNEATDLLNALAGKTADEQVALVAGALEATRESLGDDINKLNRSQEEMARKLDALAGNAAKAHVSGEAQVEKKGIGANALDVLKSRPVVVTAAAVATVAVAGAGVYAYKKYQDGKVVGTEMGGEEVLLLEQPSAVEVSKDAAVAAALGDR